MGALRWLAPRHHTCRPALYLCPVVGRQWEVKEVGDHKDVMAGVVSTWKMGTSTRRRATSRGLRWTIPTLSVYAGELIQTEHFMS